MINFKINQNTRVQPYTHSILWTCKLRSKRQIHKNRVGILVVAIVNMENLILTLHFLGEDMNHKNTVT